MASRPTNRAERLIAIEQLLFRSATGLRAVELANACGVDRRTVYRDLSLLSETGVPVFQRDGRFFIDAEHYLATLRLSIDETGSLLLAALSASRHDLQIATAAAKLSRALPQPYLRQADMDDFNRSADQAQTQAVELLTHAWRTGRRAKLWYASRDRRKVRVCEISTYFIQPQVGDGGLVVGLDCFSGRIRAFKLARVQQVELLESDYDTPVDAPRNLFYVRGSTKGTVEDEQTQSV
jgi:proteasome accessory factor B